MPVDRLDPHPTSSRTRRIAIFRMWMAMVIVAVGSTASLTLAASYPSESGQDWIDARLEKFVPMERIGVFHCESMVAHQKSLARLRDTIGQIVATGRSARGRCSASSDSVHVKSCLDSLNPLRLRVKQLRVAESSLQDSVRFHAGRCDAPTYKAWEQFQAIRGARDSATSPEIDSTESEFGSVNSPFDKLVEYEFAAIWNQERMTRAQKRGIRSESSIGQNSSGTAFRERIRAHIGRHGAKNPSAMTHFLMAVLDHRDGRDDLALARLRKVPARDTNSVWKGPVAMLYGQILAPTSPDSAIPLLLAAMRDSGLTSPALYLLATIELHQGNSLAALEHISNYLERPKAPNPGSHLLAIQLAANALVQAAQAPYRIKEVLREHLPGTARDTIAFQVAQNLLAINAAKECIELLSSFQVSYPDTRLGDEVRMYLSQVRRNRPGIVVR